MTLVMSVQARDAIFLLTDRRLSAPRQRPKDDARKVMFLDTTDGAAMLGYAGLGATMLGTEPSDWMSNVLRGRNLPLEASLGLLASVAQRELAPHLRAVPVGVPGNHLIVIPAIIDGSVRLYTLEFEFMGGTVSCKWRRHFRRPDLPPSIAFGGSGAMTLQSNPQWMRELKNTLRWYNRGKLTAQRMADFLAEVNTRVYRISPRGAVGPNAIVAWRFAKGSGGGGSHSFYQERKRLPGGILPTISGEFDVRALVNAVLPIIKPIGERRLRGATGEDIDSKEIDAALAKLPSKPDERLK